MTHDPNKVISLSVMVPSPPGAIFDLLADPRRHHEFDGSGSVRAARVNAPARLTLGAKFGMRMRIGLPYNITNTVVEFEEGRRIAWRHFGGHIWRYILEPVGDATKVTEEFDWNGARSERMLRTMNAFEKNAKAIQRTLDNLVERFDD